MKRIVSLLITAVMLCGMVSVNASAAVDEYFKCGFDDANEVIQYFVMGAFYPTDDAPGAEGGVMYGYSEARVLQSKYDDNGGYMNDSPYTYLTYDARAKVAIGVDTMNTSPEAENARALTLTYVNDHRAYQGSVDNREYMNLVLDVSKQEIYVTNGGTGDTSEEHTITERKPYEIDGNGLTWYDLGISVDKDRLRFFIDGNLVFEITDSKYLIANELESPFLLWNNNCMIIVDEVETAPVYSLFPDEVVPVEPQINFTAAPRAIYEGASELVVDVKATINEGRDVADFGFKVDYDAEKLALKSAVNAIDDSARMYSLTGNSYSCFGGDPITGELTVATLTFDVLDGAALNTAYEIGLSNGDFVQGSNGHNYTTSNEVVFTPGTVTVTTDPTPPEPEYMIGDLDDNKKCDSNDVIALLRKLAGWDNATTAPDEAADVDGSGKVDSNDAIYYLRSLAGWEGHEIG